MALNVTPTGDIFVLSVHDEEEPIHFHIPSVVPSRYDIPGINAPKEAFDSCKFSFPDQKPIQYAFRRTKNHRPYVLIRIVEPKTFILGTEQQKFDEFGKKLSPDVQRVPVPVRMELVANEIERQCGQMGLIAIQGEVTEEQVRQCEKISVEFMRKSVADTNRLAKRSPLNVTKQAIRRAARLHNMNLLNPLPEWAQINPDALDNQAQRTMNCSNCGTQYPVGVAKCSKAGCGVIFNWKLAVEAGLVKPSDVPPSKRKEAGLDFTDDTRRSTAPSPGPDPTRPEDDDEGAIESLNSPDLPSQVAQAEDEEAEDQEASEGGEAPDASGEEEEEEELRGA